MRCSWWTRVGFACAVALSLAVPGRFAGWPGTSTAQAANTTLSATFVPTADTYVDAGNPNTNYAGSTQLAVDGSPVENTYLRFNVQNLSGTVVRAALRLYNTNGQTAGYAVHALSDTSWQESTLTYNNAPSFNPAVAAQSSGLVAGEWTEVDITSLVHGNGELDLVVTSAATTDIIFGSRQSSTSPQLVVDTTASSGAPIIMAAGDIACSPTDTYYNGGAGTSTHCHEQATADLLADELPAAVLVLGDNQYSATLADYQQVYDPTWGTVKALTHPVPGNHEYLVTNASGYYDYFGDAAGSPSTGYYSYNIGSWHIVALNAQCTYVGGCQAGSPEEQWLRTDLANHPNSCTLAYWHQPRFSSGEHGNDTAYDAFWQDLYAAHVDVVLNGHDHDYERFAPQDPSEQPDSQGITEFVVGTGGKSHYSFVTLQPTRVTGNDTSFGVLKLTLHTTSFEWEFIPDGQSSSYTDFGRTSCH